MKLTTHHVRAALALIAVLATTMVLPMSLGLEPAQPLPAPLNIGLPLALAVGGILMPVAALFSRFSSPDQLGSVAGFAAPWLIFAVFLTPHWNVFPVRALCWVGLGLAFVGLIAVLFNALEQRPQHSLATGNRFE